MANKFVWSGATGANDGSAWEDAYVSLMRDWGAEAGFTPGTDFVYVRNTHSEDNAATVTITGVTPEGTSDPVRVLCVTGADTGTSPGSLTTGARVGANATFSIHINEKLYIYGVTFNPATSNLIVAQDSTDHNIVCESCTFDLDNAGAAFLYFGQTTSARGKSIVLINPTFDFANVANRVVFRICSVVIIDGTVVNDVDNFIDCATTYPFDVVFRNVDLSVVNGNLVGAVGNADAHCKISFERCKIHASATLVNGTIDMPGFEVSFYHCQSGTDADPAYQMKRFTYEGTTETDTARWRTGGSSDGERTNPYSWSMDTAAGSNVIELYEALESPPITGWTDGDASTAHTYRIYVASGATLQDDEVWVDLIGPNDAATDSLGVRNTTRPAPLATPANLTTDGSSTWNGADVGTKQQIDITYTPDKPGPITARVYFAKPSVQTRISVDPKIYIDPS